VAGEDAAPFEADATPSDPADGLKQKAVLLFQDAGDEGVNGVVVVDGDGGLGDDGAGVDAAIVEDKLDAATGELATVFERVGLRLGGHCGDTAKRWKQRGVLVDDAPGKGAQKGGIVDSVVAGQNDEVDVVAAQLLDEGEVSRGERLKAPLGEGPRRDAGGASTLERAGGRSIRQNDDDLGGEAGIGLGVEESLKRAAAARGEDAKPEAGQD
jgi:hypothetical protein